MMSRFLFLVISKMMMVNLEISEILKLEIEKGQIHRNSHLWQLEGLKGINSSHKDWNKEKITF